MPDVFAAQNVIEMIRACRSYARILVLALLLRPQISNAQNATAGSEAVPKSETTPSTIDTTGCQAIPGGKAQLRPLSKVCEFALTYRRSLPDFVCKQTTTNTGPHSTTVLEAEVTFEKGQEHYSKVFTSSKGPKENSSIEFISAGELGSDLVNLFETPTAATFRVPKEVRLRNIPSSVYEFHVAAEKNAFWILRDDRGVSLHPEYEGALWLERDNGQLLRLELRSVHLPRDFGFATVHVTIDYRQIPLGDLGKFLLPSTSTTTVCHWGWGTTDLSCTKSVLVFHDCRKFSSKARILTENPQH